MVVVVADAILEASRRPRRLNASDESLSGQQAEGVVDRLQRDGADLGPHGLGDAISGDVGLAPDRAQHSQALRRNLNAVLTKKVSLIDGHTNR
jgi:hypothetical protein